MKKFLLIPLLILFILTGCQKDNPIATPPMAAPPVAAPPVASPPTGTNIAPRAFAGADFYVVLPTNWATLNGTVNDAPGDIVHHSWRKISGPASFLIERPELLQAVVRNLVKGIYEFELMVTDRGGLTGMDTVTVEVRGPHIPVSNELVFHNLQWIFPWYPSIEVKNINLYPAPTKVFIQRDSNSAWIEVNHISNSSNNNPYEYFIETRPDGGGMYTYGSLYIVYYGTITDDSPQVKIQF